jgi:hypothetical protein
MTAKEKVKIEIYNSINKVISILDKLKDDNSKDEKYSYTDNIFKKPRAS